MERLAPPNATRQIRARIGEIVDSTAIHQVERVNAQRHFRVIGLAPC
jgi:hypothetical protein